MLEYWIADPLDAKLTILTLKENEYNATTEFTGTDLIQSATFPDLNLTVAQVRQGSL